MATQYTNAVTYMERSKLIDAATVGTVDTMMRQSSVMQLLPFAQASELMRDEFYEKGALASRLTTKRVLNETPAAKTGTSLVKKQEQLGIFSQRFQMERKFLTESSLAQRVNAANENLIMDLDHEVFNGTVDSEGKGFNGFANRCGLSASDYCFVPSGGAFSINASATNFLKFLDVVRTVRSNMLRISPTAFPVMFANSGLATAITSGRDKAGAANVGYGTLDIINNRVLLVDDIPVIVVGTDSTNAPILPQTEGGGSDCSIYLAVLDGPGGAQGPDRVPNGVCGIAPNDGVMYEEYSQSVLNMEDMLIEFFMGLRTPKRSLVRVPNLQFTAA